MPDPVSDALAADLAKVASSQRFTSVSTAKGTVVPKRGTEYAEDVRALRALSADDAADIDGHFGVTAVGSEWSRDP